MDELERAARRSGNYRAARQLGYKPTDSEPDWFAWVIMTVLVVFVVGTMVVSQHKLSEPKEEKKESHVADKPYVREPSIEFSRRSPSDHVMINSGGGKIKFMIVKEDGSAELVMLMDNEHGVRVLKDRFQIVESFDEK